MTDPVKPTPTRVLPEDDSNTRWADDSPPVFELTTKELIFPQDILGKTVFIHMKPYKSADLMELQRIRAVRMTQAGGDISDIKDAGLGEVLDFFWKHFVKLSGPGVVRKDKSEGTPEEHALFIKNHPRLDIERSTVLTGYGGLDIQVEDVELGSLLDITDTNQVVTYKSLYCPERKRVVRYTITHVFRQENEKDFRKYQQASGNVRVYTRKRESTIRVNYSQIEALYNSMIKSVEGVIYEGKPCAAEHDINPWINWMPYWWKDMVMTELFRGAQEKKD